MTRGWGRFLSADPIENEYPYHSSYSFAGDMPIWAVDLDGAEFTLFGTSGLLPGNSALTIGEAATEGDAVIDIAPAPI